MIKCIDCKHCMPSEVRIFIFNQKARWEFSRCSIAGFDSGRAADPKQTFCDIEREFGCGPDAKNFEPRDKPLSWWAKHVGMGR